MVILQGKAYKSVKEAAKEHQLNASALSNRIQRHGKDWPYLLKTYQRKHGVLTP